MEFRFEATVESTFECRLEKNGVEIENWTDCSTKTVLYDSLDDGEYLFMVKATALYGTKENTPAFHSWTVDTTAPKVRITSKPSKSSPYTSGTFVFECVDETSCTFECELDETAVDCSEGYYSFAGIEEGDHRFTIEATDSAGNKSVHDDSTGPYLNDYSWNVNDEHLGIIITVKPPLYSDSDSAVFEFESNKAAAFECKLDEGDYESCVSGINYTGLDDGEHTFTVKATFGEQISFEEHIWTVDTEAPVITFSSTPDDPTYQTGAVFSYSVNEPASLKCKLATDAEWSSCGNTKVYFAGTFGIDGTKQTYTFEVRATDQAGNTGFESYTWTVDLVIPTIEWISPAPGPDGNVAVGKSDDVYSGDPAIYAINVVVKISGSDPGQPVNVDGFKTPPGYTIVNVDDTSPKNYTLTIGLQHGARVNNPLTITVEDDAGSEASLNKLVIVNTEMPTITWASPSNNYKFISTTTAPSFKFNVWNAIPETDIELVDSDTGGVIGTKQAVGGSSGYQEHVTINPEIEDRCTPYKFYGRFYDELEAITVYTNAVTDPDLKTVRTVTVDRNPAVIENVDIPGITEIDRILNRDKNLNPDPDDGMMTNITVDISDVANPDDSNRKVELFTGIALLATLTGQGDTAVFQNIALAEGNHVFKVDVTDCSGNITSKTLASVTVDTVKPELTLMEPKGSSSNWRWLVAADDPELGTIVDGDFTGIEMEVVSDEIIGSIIKVEHTVYNYSDVIINGPNDITASSVLEDDITIKITLPDLEYGKHRFTVTVDDIAGNESTLQETYEVDVIVPQIRFEDDGGNPYIEDGQVFDEDADPETAGFQISIKMDVWDIQPQSTYTLKAVPVLSQGGEEDTSRTEKTWTGTVTGDGTLDTIERDITIGGGWWRFSAVIKDNHLNESATGEFDVEVDIEDPNITLRKGYGYSTGEGPVISGDSELSPAWMIPGDVNCTDDDCYTEIEVWTDAPAGSEISISVNGGASVEENSVSDSGQSYAEFNIILDNSLEYNTIFVKIVSTTLAEAEVLHYIKIDENPPVLTLINPVDCSSQEVCRRLDLFDNPATPDYIELAELGYGYADDALSGGVLNFKASGVIRFEIEGATDGTVVVESVIGGSVPGIANYTAPILYDEGNDIYYAEFTNMTVEDSNPLGQTDYDLVFKVTEEPSGATSKYLINLHLDLAVPSAIDIAGNLSVNAKTGEVNVNWDTVSGNDSTLGGIEDAVHEYNVRYQDYNEGTCSIAASFGDAKKPLETIAGPVPETDVEGITLEYGFYVNRIDNGESGENLVEADIHKNGNKYCFAVRAVDAVYANDGTVLAKNNGNISPYDAGEVKMDWQTLRDENFGYHSLKIRNLGDLDGDGKDDFVIVDSWKSSDGINNDYGGHIEIIFSCLLYTSPSPRDRTRSRMPSSA